MFTGLQQLDLRNESTISGSAVTDGMVYLYANTTLLRGLLIIPTTSGVVLIA